MKKTTTKLSKQLAKYGALSVAIAGVSNVDGQIIYTDVNPDVGGANVMYLLDLNNDGTIDFNIKNVSLGSPYGYALNLFPANGNSALGFLYIESGESYQSVYAYALNSGEVISGGKTSWQSYYYQFMNYGSCIDSGGSSYLQWCGVTDKYLGLRFDISGNTHYGWARLDVGTDSNNWVIKDYAYNASLAGSGRGILAEGAPIMAGEGGVLSVNDNVFSKIKIVALNKSIALFNLPQNTNYRLFSLTGQSVLDGKITNNTYVIEANTLANGVYIIELKDTNTNAIIRKKVVL